MLLEWSLELCSVRRTRTDRRTDRPRRSLASAGTVCLFTWSYSPIRPRLGRRGAVKSREKLAANHIDQSTLRLCWEERPNPFDPLMEAEEDDRIYLVMGDDEIQCYISLGWALRNVPPHKTLVLVHIFRPAFDIPTTLNLPGDDLVGSAYSYGGQFWKKHVRAEKLTAENDDVAAALLDLIAQHQITTLILGSVKDRVFDATHMQPKQNHISEASKEPFRLLLTFASKAAKVKTNNKIICILNMHRALFKATPTLTRLFDAEFVKTEVEGVVAALKDSVRGMLLELKVTVRRYKPQYEPMQGSIVKVVHPLETAMISSPQKRLRNNFLKIFYPTPSPLQKFESAVNKACKSQIHWKVNSPVLRIELRTIVIEYVVQAYKTYLDSLEETIRGDLEDLEPNLKSKLSELFEG
ncbi:hypothetical protein U9M48_016679 [Paspalum notatum var. saurae]|uniref:Exocyst subunit Exo70 family protein n=1 Tax=Paspalum notatum var. saurae TaxID=547442 RepID=A0AAQ3T851_PASNO